MIPVWSVAALSVFGRLTLIKVWQVPFCVDELGEHCDRKWKRTELNSALKKKAVLLYITRVKLRKFRTKNLFHKKVSTSFLKNSACMTFKTVEPASPWNEKAIQKVKNTNVFSDKFYRFRANVLREERETQGRVFLVMEQQLAGSCCRHYAKVRDLLLRPLW